LLWEGSHVLSEVSFLPESCLNFGLLPDNCSGQEQAITGFNLRKISVRE
jgi:hypothetical protein